MLDFREKKVVFYRFLKEKDGSYGDNIREEIEFYFDGLDNNLDFLNKFQSKEEIFNFVNMLVSKVIMNEHQDGFDDIMQYYCR